MSNSSTLSSDERIRAEVSKTYAAAISRTASGGGCCSSKATTANVETIGYRVDEVASLPDDAVVSSFGCGNPLAFCGVKEGQTVLDLGSGAGLDLLIARQRTGESGRVIGVDMTDAMIERARANIAKLGHTNVEVRKGIIEELPVESGTVDWVISNCVINLSPDKPRVFSEIARVLKPGGTMSVSDIVVKDLPWWMRKSMAIYASCVGGAISEEDYLAGLRRAGLNDARVEERMLFSTAQISAFANDMLPKFMRGPLRPLQRVAAGFISAFAARYAGRVWSAKFVATKPAPCCAAAAAEAESAHQEPKVATSTRKLGGGCCGG